MGYEYIISLRDCDLDRLSKNSCGVTTIQQLLQEVPGYQGMKAENHFLYCMKPDQENVWYSSIHLDGNTLLLCTYAGEDFQAITSFLFSHLLDLCGHFEIEEA